MWFWDVLEVLLLLATIYQQGKIYEHQKTQFKFLEVEHQDLMSKLKN